MVHHRCRGGGDPGGILTADEIHLAAVAQANGIDGLRLLHTTDPRERVELIALTIKTAEVRENYRRNMPVNVLAHAWMGGDDT